MSSDEKLQQQFYLPLILLLTWEEESVVVHFYTVNHYREKNICIWNLVMKLHPKSTHTSLVLAFSSCYEIDKPFSFCDKHNYHCYSKCFFHLNTIRHGIFSTYILTRGGLVCAPCSTRGRVQNRSPCCKYDTVRGMIN